MKILRVADIADNPHTGMGGYLAQTTAELRRRGHDVRHVWADDLVPAIGGRARRLASPAAVVARVRAVRREWGDLDVVEVHEPLGAAYGLAHRALRLPPMVALSFGLEVRSWAAARERSGRRHEPIPLKSRILVPLTLVSQARIVYRTAAAIAVPSSADREWLLAHGRAPEHVVLAPTGVADAMFVDVPRAPDRPFTVLFIGSWIDRKGAPEIAAAWPQIRDAVPDARLIIAGAGVASASVLDDFVGEGSSVDVFERLTTREIGDQLRRADVFLLPSWFEGLPLSALEAAAAGLPSVLSTVCGNLDLARPSAPEADGALLVPPHDAEAVARAVVRLAKDKRLRVALGFNGRARAREFSWRRTADALEDAYRVATGAPRAA